MATLTAKQKALLAQAEAMESATETQAEETEQSISFKAIITSKASKTKTKSNKGIYVYHGVTILEGPAEGMKVLGIRTLINKDGEENAPVVVDQEVQVFPRRAVDEETGATRMFFEISTGVELTDEEAVLAAFEGMGF